MRDRCSLWLHNELRIICLTAQALLQSANLAVMKFPQRVRRTIDPRAAPAAVGRRDRPARSSGRVRTGRLHTAPNSQKNRGRAGNAIFEALSFLLVSKAAGKPGF